MVIRIALLYHTGKDSEGALLCGDITMPAKRISITLPAGPKVEDSINLVQWAQQRGYQDAWLADAGAPDSLTLCGILAGYAEKLRLGVAVTPVYTRTPAVLAATANCLAQVLPGRFVLGLGSSSQTMMENWHGQDMDKPLTRVKETALMVRAMLAGEKSNFDLETLSSHGYRQPPVSSTVPVYLAALRGRMIEMAAEYGDGVIFNLWPEKALPKMMAHVKTGVERAGKNLADVEIVNRHMVCVTDDTASARQRFRAAFAPYYANPVYNRFLAWAGYEEAAMAIAEGWQAKDREKTTGAISDTLADEIAVIGSADHCRERILVAAEGGVHTHVIAPLPGNQQEMMATYEAFSGDQFSF